MYNEIQEDQFNQAYLKGFKKPSLNLLKKI